MLVDGQEVPAPEGTRYRGWFLINQPACPPVVDIVNSFGQGNAQITGGIEALFIVETAPSIFEGFILEWYFEGSGEVIQRWEICYQYGA